jgi:nucleoside-diphosphate-sugar epimerase
MTKRVLVTGGSGFLGKPSLPALASRGYDVHAVHSTGPPGGPATWHRVDLHDRDRVSRLLDEVRPTHLLHFAWYLEHGKVWGSTENLRWVESSLSLLRGFAERGGSRCAIAGTCAEYDWRHGYCSERITPTTAATLYGISKNALHGVAAEFARQVGLSLAWGRVFSPFGPDERLPRLVPAVIRSLMERREVRCSHRDKYRDYLYVDDCADAFATLLDGEVEGPVNVCSGTPISIGELVGTLVELIPGSESVPIVFGAVPTTAGDPVLLVGDNQRLANEVGWMPRVGLREGLSRTIEHWRSRSASPG